jgi:putative flippase GtrA
MRSIYKKLFSSTLFRYIFIGGLSFAIEMGVLYSLIHFFQLSSILAVAISFWVGLITSFVLQKLIAFQDKGSSTKKILRQSIYYAILVLFNYAFTIGFVALLEGALTLFIARTIALIITTGWNFIVYSKIIFKKELEA